MAAFFLIWSFYKLCLYHWRVFTHLSLYCMHNLLTMSRWLLKVEKNIPQWTLDLERMFALKSLQDTGTIQSTSTLFFPVLTLPSYTHSLDLFIVLNMLASSHNKDPLFSMNLLVRVKVSECFKGTSLYDLLSFSFGMAILKGRVKSLLSESPSSLVLRKQDDISRIFWMTYLSVNMTSSTAFG